MVYLIYTLMTWKPLSSLFLSLISFLVFLKLLSLSPDTPSLLPFVRLHRKFRPLKNPSWRIPNMFTNGPLACHLSHCWSTTSVWMLTVTVDSQCTTRFCNLLPPIHPLSGFVHLCSWLLWQSTVVLPSCWVHSCRAESVRGPTGHCPHFSWELHHVLDKVWLELSCR